MKTIQHSLQYVVFWITVAIPSPRQVCQIFSCSARCFFFRVFILPLIFFVFYYSRKIFFLLVLFTDLERSLVIYHDEERAETSVPFKISSSKKEFLVSPNVVFLQSFGVHETGCAQGIATLCLLGTVVLTTKQHSPPIEHVNCLLVA